AGGRGGHRFGVRAPRGWRLVLPRAIFRESTMRVAPVVDVIAVVTLGLAAGAMLTEGAFLVPYWRALPPRDFLAWYAANADRLVALFGPLEVLAAVATAVAASLSASSR